MKSNKVRYRSELYSSTEEQVHAETGCEEDYIYDALVKPNFQILSDEYPEFAKAWNKLRECQKDHSHINRNSRKAFSTVLGHTFNVALTRALLHKFFQLSLPSMPEGHLCPPVPNRFHYVQWLRTLLRQMYDSDDEYFSPNQVGRCRFKGLDIGCGASAIYPLLLSTPAFTQSLFTTKKEDPVYPTTQSWKFLGTDINADSVKCAKQNVLGMIYTLFSFADFIFMVHGSLFLTYITLYSQQITRHYHHRVGSTDYESTTLHVGKCPSTQGGWKHYQPSRTHLCFHDGGSICFSKQ